MYTSSQEAKLKWDIWIEEWEATWRANESQSMEQSRSKKSITGQNKVFSKCVWLKSTGQNRKRQPVQTPRFQCRWNHRLRLSGRTACGRLGFHRVTAPSGLFVSRAESDSLRLDVDSTRRRGMWRQTDESEPDRLPPLSRLHRWLEELRKNKK